MKNKLHPCIWCNNNANEMAEFYLSVFPDAEIAEENETVVMLNIEGQRFMLLNGGDYAKPNPSVSMMFLSPDSGLIDELWYKFLHGGKIFMEKNSYDWSTNYGWIEDKYGVSWQLYTGPSEHIIQTIVPTLMFTKSNNGKAREAAAYYRSVFPGSSERGIMENENGGVAHGEFIILDYLIMMMDGGEAHEFSFDEGVSLVVNCEDQDEIDRYWNELTSNGGSESQCGWLKDKYGISWQIIPQNILQLLENPGAMDAMMKMKKIEIKDLK